MIEEPFPPYMKDRKSGKVFAFSMLLLEDAQRDLVACYTPEGDETKPASLRAGLEAIMAEPSGTIEYEIEKDLEAEKNLKAEISLGKDLAVKLIEHLIRMGAEGLELPVTIAGKEYLVIGRPVKSADELGIGNPPPFVEPGPASWWGKIINKFKKGGK